MQLKMADNKIRNLREKVSILKTVLRIRKCKKDAIENRIKKRQQQGYQLKPQKVWKK